MYWIYVLKSERFDQIYIGYTSNLQQRFDTHNAGEVSSTRRYQPWRLVYIEGYHAQSDALRRERSLKRFGQASFHLKRRISDSLHGTSK